MPDFTTVHPKLWYGAQKPPEAKGGEQKGGLSAPLCRLKSRVDVRLRICWGRIHSRKQTQLYQLQTTIHWPEWAWRLAHPSFHGQLLTAQSWTAGNAAAEPREHSRSGHSSLPRFLRQRQAAGANPERICRETVPRRPFRPLPLPRGPPLEGRRDPHEPFLHRPRLALVEGGGGAWEGRQRNTFQSQLGLRLENHPDRWLAPR